MRKIFGAAGMAVGLAMTMSAPASAGNVLLPGQGGGTVSCGLGPTNNCLTFSDFTVFSLALLEFQATHSNNPPNSGDAYYVPSSPGDLNKNAITVFTGASGVSNPVGQIDNPYDSPNHVAQNSTVNFLMVAPDPSPTWNTALSQDNVHQPSTTVVNPAAPFVSGAQPPVQTGSLPLWDISVADLKNYLQGGALDFFFNLNQTKANDDTTYLTTPQDMLAYLAVTLTSADGSVSHTWYLNGNNCTGTGGNCLSDPHDAQVAGLNDILPTAADQWAYVHGTICAAPDGSVVWLGHCAASPNPLPPGSKDVDQNLGANNASFALFSQGLNDALFDPTNFWYQYFGGTGGTMSVDARMAGLNNGFEQLFIIAGNRIPNIPVPEPVTLTLFGAGLAGLGLLRLRRKNRA